MPGPKISEEPPIATGIAAISTMTAQARADITTTQDQILALRTLNPENNRRHSLKLGFSPMNSCDDHAASVEPAQIKDFRDITLKILYVPCS